MKIVIEIGNEHYERIMRLEEDVTVYPTTLALYEAVKNGAPLPEHHGRLKDIDAFITKVKADRNHSVYLRSWTADDVLNALDNSYAPTIIEGSESK